MYIQFYCDFLVSECWKDKEKKIKRRLRCRKLDPTAYIVALSAGEQNHLDIISALFLKQHKFQNMNLFIIGIAAGYGEALLLVKKLTETVVAQTGDADLRRYIMLRQEEFYRTGR